MSLSIQEVELQVTMAVLAMSTVKEATFWRSFAEVMYQVSKQHTSREYVVISEAAHIRLGEFTKSWNVNLYNRRFHK